MTNKNPYIPFPSKIKEVIKHTDKEYTFRMEFAGDVKPGQFFEVSIPKYGEAPISVSGIGEDFVDLTIRRVGRVTNEVFERYVGDSLLIRHVTLRRGRSRCRGWWHRRVSGPRRHRRTDGHSRAKR